MFRNLNNSQKINSDQDLTYLITTTTFIIIMVYLKNYANYYYDDYYGLYYLYLQYFLYHSPPQNSITQYHPKKEITATNYPHSNNNSGQDLF